MSKILVFAGTTEGRLLLNQLAELPVEVIASVATDYGRECLPEYGNIDVQVNRLTEHEMVELMEQHQFTWVIDATHPYATEVTANIRKACQRVNQSYLRLMREEQRADNCHYVQNLQEAVEFLQQTQGNILLTTGSKELAPFTQLEEYQQRVYPRILPMVDGIEKCLSLGFLGRNIIAMQGPFSAQLNAAMLKEINGQFLVTKETGNTGGFFEKLEGAKIAGTQVIVIERPKEADGYSLQQIIKAVSN